MALGTYFVHFDIGYTSFTYLEKMIINQVEYLSSKLPIRSNSDISNRLIMISRVEHPSFKLSVPLNDNINRLLILTVN